MFSGRVEGPLSNLPKSSPADQGAGEGDTPNVDFLV